MRPSPPARRGSRRDHRAWQDRLSRENGRATAEVWEALEAAGVRLVCAAEGLDTATGDHEITFTIKAAVAREQWKRHRANWERARRNSIDRGVFPGTTPVGYSYEKGSNRPLEVDSREAKKVVEAFELRASGMPFSVIARRFGWGNSATRHVLANEAYLGVVRHGGFRRENAHEPIVSRELFDAVQAARTVQPTPPGDTTRDRLLVGLARCKGCGATLRAVRRKARDGTYVYSYFCVDRGKKPCRDRAWVRAVELDSFVARGSRTRSGRCRAWSTSSPPDATSRRRRPHRRRPRSSCAATSRTPMSTGRRLFQHGHDARQRRIEEARDRVRHLSARQTRLPVGGPLSVHWQRFDALERHDVLAGFIDRVEVSRGASSDLPGSVRILWADGTVACEEDAPGWRRRSTRTNARSPLSRTAGGTLTR